MDDLRSQLEAVRESRARVAAAADAERRRIERALHDGVQQDLIALAVNLQLARELVDGSENAPLEAASRDVHDALDGVRALAEGVYPSLLVDRGLAEALRSAARAARMPTRIDAPDDRYAPDVEAAVYFACTRALADVEQAAHSSVRVWPEGGALLFEVVFEGGGIADLSGVEDRVGAAGGALSVTTEPLTLRASVPL